MKPTERDAPAGTHRPLALSRVRSAFAALMLLVAAAYHSFAAFAAEPPAPPAGPQDVDTAVVVDLNDQPHSGKLIALDDEMLTVVAVQPLRLKTSDVISLRFPGRKTPSLLPGSVVFLENGDRLAVHLEALDGERVTGRWASFPGLPPLVIPVETIRGIFLNAPRTAAAQRSMLRELLDRKESSDVFLLNNNDRLTGELKSVDRATVTLANATGETRVERTRVSWIGCNQDLISFPKSSEGRALVALADGSRITARSLKQTEDGRLRLDAVFGAKVEVPLSSVVTVLFLGGKVDYLSDLEPAKYEFTPFLSKDWPLRRDRAVDGGRMFVRGVESLKGLGVHSHCRVRYHLGGQYRQFLSLVGIDDMAEGRGSARFAVEVDGRRAFASDEITGKDAPLRVGPIDLTGAQDMTLVVEFGALGDVLDCADWCEALLVK